MTMSFVFNQTLVPYKRSGERFQCVPSYNVPGSVFIKPSARLLGRVPAWGAGPRRLRLHLFEIRQHQFSGQLRHGCHLGLE